MNQILTEHDFVRTLPIIRVGTYSFFSRYLLKLGDECRNLKKS